MKTKKSWGWIIFWIIVFWPIGIYLLFKRLGNDRSALMSENSNILTISGIILALFAVLGFFGNLTHFGTALFSLILYGAGAYFVLQKANTTKRKAAKYKSYLNLIVNQQITDSNQIANQLGISPSTVDRDIHEMIAAGYLPQNYNVPLAPEVKSHEDIIQQERIVKCPACGANNKGIVGKIAECEYCGTQIG